MAFDDKRLYFICPYNSIYSRRELSVTPSSVTYSQYIIDAIHSLYVGHLTVIALAGGKNRSYGYRRVFVSDREDHIYLASINSSLGKIAVRFNQFWLYLQLIIYTLFKTRKTDNILIYHDYGLSFIYKLMKFFSGAHFTYVTAEIFSAVYNRGDKKIEQEIKHLKGANSYVFINNLLPEKFNVKTYAVCYGNYKYARVEGERFNDGLIHAVYAGKISSIISDAFLAVECASYCNENIHIHILGYGNEDDIALLKQRVFEINKQRGFYVISYDGCLSGDEYEAFLSKCQVGLCPRVLTAELAQYCFPSKTMVYLTHGLIPICPNIPVFNRCDFANSLVLVDNISPESLAESLNRLNVAGFNPQTVVENLDTAFKKSLERILNN